MTYIKINFGGNFEDEFQKAVDEVFHLVRPAFKNYECIWRPNIDVYESVEEVIVLADMRVCARVGMAANAKFCPPFRVEPHASANHGGATVSALRYNPANDNPLTSQRRHRRSHHHPAARVPHHCRGGPLAQGAP